MVFTPSPLLTMTIEARPDGAPDIHLHAGGQGIWIARLLARLEVEARLCAPFGGETGAVLATLVERDGISLRGSPGAGENGSYVHDRRGGERTAIAETPPPFLPRHQLDELYDLALIEGLAAGVAVLGGPDGEQVLPPDTYRRLAGDLVTCGVPVVADLAGDYLTAAAAGRVSVLRASHRDLIRDGRAASDTPDEIMAAMEKLASEGADTVIVSRAAQPALVLADGRFSEIPVPEFEGRDHRGAGDSMTGGLAAGLVRGEGLEQSLKLGAAAGALNATRHGLGTGHRDLIEQLARRIEIHPVQC